MMSRVSLTLAGPSLAEENIWVRVFSRESAAPGLQLTGAVYSRRSGQVQYDEVKETTHFFH